MFSLPHRERPVRALPRRHDKPCPRFPAACVAFALTVMACLWARPAHAVIAYIIAYSCNRVSVGSSTTGNYHIWMSGTQVTSGSTYNDIVPSWSPTFQSSYGGYIAFERDNPSTGSADIWVANINSDMSIGYIYALTTGGVYHHPSWSPDGNTIACSVDVAGSGRQIETFTVGNLWQIDLSGNLAEITVGSPSQLTTTGNNIDPCWQIQSDSSEEPGTVFGYFTPAVTLLWTNTASSGSIVEGDLSSGSPVLTTLTSGSTYGDIEVGQAAYWWFDVSGAPPAAYPFARYGDDDKWDIYTVDDAGSVTSMESTIDPLGVSCRDRYPVYDFQGIPYPNGDSWYYFTLMYFVSDRPTNGTDADTFSRNIWLYDPSSAYLDGTVNPVPVTSDVNGIDFKGISLVYQWATPSSTGGPSGPGGPGGPP